jgi:aromatic ring-cleaving dioxygenase
MPHIDDHDDPQSHSQSHSQSQSQSDTQAAAVTPRIQDWHAHVYFDASSRNAAWDLRQVIEARLGDVVALGRFHEKPVGPHPQWSYQIAFDDGQFRRVFEWLVMHHGALDIFVHPNTGHALSDHRDRAVWIGRSYPLNLGIFG